MADALTEQWVRLLESWSAELQSTTNRLNYLIGNRQKYESGSYRESLIRRLLRQVLPERFRISTGFIHRWPTDPSRQLDVIVWDAQEHAAILEEGDLVVLAPEAVAAIIEVKTTLTAGDQEKALDVLFPPGVHVWHPQSTDRVKQETMDLPYRAIFAFSHDLTTPGAAVRRAFDGVTELCRERFGEDSKKALGHTSRAGFRYVNLLDSLCIADCAHIDQTNATVLWDGGKYDGPALVGFASPLDQNIAVGRFCMSLQARLTSWPANKTADETLKAQLDTTDPGLWCFGHIPHPVRKAFSWGIEVNPDRVKYPDTPLWMQD